MTKTYTILFGMAVVLVALITVTSIPQKVFHFGMGSDNHHEMEHVHGNFSENEMTAEELSEAVLMSVADGKYKCCLSEVCTSCFIRHQDEEDLICDCLEHLVVGDAPCRECVNGILVGKGNRYLAPYFALALTEESDEERYSEMVALITEQYGIPAEQQYR